MRSEHCECRRHSCRDLLKSSAGRIVNVSSGAGQLSDMGTWSPAYAASKTTLNAITCLLAAALKDKGIAVNSVCPGWCRTEMGGPNAPRSVEEGAAGIVWLAADAPQDKTGLFWRDWKSFLGKRLEFCFDQPYASLETRNHSRALRRQTEESFGLPLNRGCGRHRKARAIRHGHGQAKPPSLMSGKAG